MNIMKLLAVATLSSSMLVVVGCASYGQNRTTAAVVSDSSITTKVKADLLVEKDVNSFDINVNTFNGVVQLSGFVNSRWQAEKAVQVAAAVNGVVSVRNDLAYKSK